MGQGLLLLTCVGKENIYLSSEPDITFFKASYKRYTNFLTETAVQYFTNTPDFGRCATVNISKNADLLSNIYIYVKLPDIVKSNHSILPENIKKFRWVNKIGLAIIKYVDLEIGGTLIERNFSDWLNIWYELNLDYGKTNAFNKMIGNIEVLTSFTNSKSSYELNIPLNFWFCQDAGIALPLISMIHDVIKIHVEFNSFTSVYNESPTNYMQVNELFCLFTYGELIKQTVVDKLAIGIFVYYDNIKQYIYYNKVKGDFITPSELDKRYVVVGSDSLFEINITPNTLITQDEPYFKYNYPSIIESYLLVNYIYLDNDERFVFLNKSHDYLIPMVQNIHEQFFNSANITYKIPFINSNKVIFWRAQLNSNIMTNDLFNYSLYPITNKYNNIIEKEYINLNSINSMSLANIELYTNLQIYLNNYTSSSTGINMYSFSLYPKCYQPSGSLNFSSIDNSYIKITLNNTINYQNSVSIKGYGLQYNIFKIVDGLSTLEFV